jgi:hypothetical protein
MGKTTDTLRDLASQIAKLEGKKSQARIGEVREILKLVCVLDCKHWLDNSTIPAVLLKDGPIDLLMSRSMFLLAKQREKNAKAKKKSKKTSR